MTEPEADVTAVQIPPDAETFLWGELHEGTYRHLYPSRMAITSVCGPTGPLHRVRVTADPEGPYHGWWDAAQRRFAMIYPDALLVSICFTYGPEAEERRGRGLRTRLRVERVDGDGSDESEKSP
jgi:hypothetical protein